MERLIALVLIATIGYGFYASKRTPAPSIAGEVPITRYDTDTHFWRGDKDAEERIRVQDRTGAFEPLYFDMDERGLLHQTPEQSRSGAVVVDYQHQRYLSRTWLDVGAWSGVVGTSSGDRPLQLGLRASPARFFDGILAPDLVASEHALGVGFSAYPPRELALCPPWAHLGLGVWYMAAYNGHGVGPALGLSLTIR